MPKPGHDSQITPKELSDLVRWIAFQWQVVGEELPYIRENAVRALCKVRWIPRSDLEAQLDTFWLEGPDTLQ